jgi:hypothetical protein
VVVVAVSVAAAVALVVIMAVRAVQSVFKKDVGRHPVAACWKVWRDVLSLEVLVEFAAALLVSIFLGDDDAESMTHQHVSLL